MKLWQQSVVEGRYVMSYQLSSTQWRQVESFLPGRPGWVGVTAKDNRTFVNGGKPGNVAVVAVMHKILLQLNAVARRGTPWVPQDA